MRDRPGAGTHYQDRMDALTGVCFRCGVHRLEPETGRKLPIVRGGEILAPSNGFIESYGLIVPEWALRKVLGLEREFAHALNVKSVAIEQQGGIVWVHVPLPHPAIISYDLALSLAPSIPAGHTLLGISDDGQQMTLDLDNAPHAVVIGATGSGKSTLLRTMVRSCLEQPGARIALFDPAEELMLLSGSGPIWQDGYFADDGDIETCLLWIARAIHQGQQQGRLYLFVDEAPRLCERRALRDALVSIGNQGRRYGVHLVLGAQRELSAALMANIRVSIVGQMRDAQHAAFATGQSKTGAERITDPGRFIVTKGALRANLHAAMIAPDELAQLARQYPPRCGVVPALPKAAPVSHQAPQVTVAQSVAPIAPSVQGGRLPDDLPEAVARAIRAYWMEKHRPLPRRRIAALIGEKDIDNDKRERWLDVTLPSRWRRV